MGVGQRCHDLVSHVNSSPQSNECLMRVQKENFEEQHQNGVPLKLVTDVKTHWWSTYVFVECIVKLQPALL